MNSNIKLQSFFFYIIIYLVTLNISFTAYGFNNSISGRVLDSVDKTPLPGVNIYLSGTTFGTATNNNGYYFIKNVPPGNYILVVSMIGYKVENKELNVTNGSKLENDFSLNRKTYELNPIEVKANRPRQWYKDLDIFLDHFLGTTSYSTSCKIENDFILDLKWNNDTLFASASEPLIVYNRALGYKIDCDLKAFFYDDKNELSWSDYNSYYSELKSTDSDEIEKWQENRLENFSTSLTYFLLWLKSHDEDDTEFLFRTFSKLIQSETYADASFHIFEKSFIKIDSTNGSYKLSFNKYLNVKDTKTKEQSFIKLLYNEITIDEFGYPIEKKPFIVYGFWSKAGLSNQLPKYYGIKDITSLNK